jgi:hypothetical protein
MQDLGGYDELSLDDLDRIMLTDEDPVAKAKEEEEEAKKKQEEDDLVDPNPDDEADEEDESDAADEAEEEEEEASESKEDQDKGKEEKQEVEESPLEKRIRLLERRLELEALERVKETEARKRAELLASKQAGRAGFLQQQLKKSPAKAQPDKKAEAGADEDDPWADKEAAQETRQEQDLPAQEMQPQMNEDRVELVRITIEDEGNRFAKDHAGDLEEMPEKFINRLQELMQEEAAPYVQELTTSSLKAVRKLARSLMNSAYATARIEFSDSVAENTKTEVEQRKAASVAKSKRRKAKAAISKGGKAAKPQPKSKSYDDMTLEELEVEMKKEFGEDYRLGSDVARHGGL